MSRCHMGKAMIRGTETQPGVSGSPGMTNAAARPTPFGDPAQLAQPGTAGDERPLLRAETQRRLHGPILLVIEMSSETVREDRRLNEVYDGV